LDNRQQLTRDHPRRVQELLFQTGAIEGFDARQQRTGGIENGLFVVAVEVPTTEVAAGCETTLLEKFSNL
jgi:hypothetical protein